ncbi:hypothetical protein B0H21DRAFT_725800 [Amylocystis lapponica]|nr:hypothetical protein B0H21DRAFT_725800 [Amylocystis lapponica]
MTSYPTIPFLGSRCRIAFENMTSYPTIPFLGSRCRIPNTPIPFEVSRCCGHSIVTVHLHFSSPLQMSAFCTFGFFALTAGRRTTATSPSGSSTYFCYYNTTIQCRSGAMLPAELRVYSPPSDVILRDDTVAFVGAKVFAPLQATALLEAYCLYPCPGDPTSDDYESSIPDMPHPIVYGVGVVRGNHTVLEDGKSKAFPVSVQDRLRNESMSCVIQCMYAGDSPRWKNVPPPNPNSCIHFTGVCSRVRADGLLGIVIESITFNVGPPPAAGGGVGSPMTPVSSPTKRRKFNAAAPTPDASPSTSRTPANVITIPPMMPPSSAPIAPSDADPFVDRPSSPFGDEDYLDVGAEVRQPPVDAPQPPLDVDSTKVKGKRRGKV